MDSEMSVFPRVSRRDFLKYCSALAAVIGAGEAAGPKVAKALETQAKRPSLVWSGFMECTGCSVSLTQNTTPGVANLILSDISLDYHETVMAAAGKQAEERFQELLNEGGFFYVVEGALASGVPQAIMIAGKNGGDILKEAYSKAKATIAIGSCACYGNIQAANPNPTGAKGVAQYLKEDADIANPTVINVSRCPGNADDLIAVVAYVLYYGKLPELDTVGRPKFLYGQTLHDNCERRGHFENGEFVEVFGDAGSQKRWCLYKMGCKGPQTYAPCSTTKWNSHRAWCVQAGPCIGCAEPGFWDKFGPFRSVAGDASQPVGGISPTSIGIGLAAATAVGLLAHGVVQTATGRLGHGGPSEDEKGSKGGKS